MTLRELREKRARTLTRAREIVDKAERENRALTDEERKHYDSAIAEYQTQGEDIQRRERLEQLEAEEARLADPANPERRSGRGDRDGGDSTPPDPERRGDRSGPQTVTVDGVEYRENDPARPRASRGYNAAFRTWLTGGMAEVRARREQRALQADLDVSGGFVVAPEQFSRRLIQAVDDAVFFRGLADVEMVTESASLGIATLDSDPSDPVWTAEVATGDEDSDMGFGKREVRPYPLAKRIKVSNKLMRLVPSIETTVVERLRYKFGVAEENGYLNGNGVNKPLGVFVASADGISTGRDVVTGSNTDFTADGLKDGKYTLKAAYWSRARWIMHRLGVKRVAKLKDSDGQYIWSDGSRTIQGGEPDRLMGFPVAISEFAPSDFSGAGNYVAVLGDFKLYKIVEALTMTMQRLVELYAEENRTGFIGRREIDGQPVLEEAFVRMKTGT